MTEREEIISEINKVKSLIREAKESGGETKGLHKILKGYVNALVDMDSFECKPESNVFRKPRKGARRVDWDGYVNSDGSDTMDEDWREEV